MRYKLDLPRLDTSFGSFREQQKLVKLVGNDEILGRAVEAFLKWYEKEENRKLKNGGDSLGTSLAFVASKHAARSAAIKLLENDQEILLTGSYKKSRKKKISKAKPKKKIKSK